MIDFNKLIGFCVALASVAFFASPAQTKVGHVIHISVDGLRGDSLKLLVDSSPALYPTFTRFVTEGATTFNARSDVFSVETLPNHTTILTGRPVARPTGAPATVYHGVMDNTDPGATGTVHNLGNPNLTYIASTFDVAHDYGLRTGLYSGKDKFELFDRSYDAVNGAEDSTGADNGRDKIDSFAVAVLAHQLFLSDLQSHGFGYSFLHYTHPDGVGHNSGWNSPAWNSIIQFIDSDVGKILTAVQTDRELANDTVVILTADHGGENMGHDSITSPANYTVPLLVWGKGVTAGADLYALNSATRRDPGPAQPSYAAALQPIRNGDTANLAMQLLGLPPVPGSTINASQDLVVGIIPEPGTLVLASCCLGLLGVRIRRSQL